jgi:hypothetical protein
MPMLGVKRPLPAIDSPDVGSPVVLPEGKPAPFGVTGVAPSSRTVGATGGLERCVVAKALGSTVARVAGAPFEGVSASTLDAC